MKNYPALVATAIGLLVCGAIIKSSRHGGTGRNIAVVIEFVLIVVAIALGFRMYLIAQRNAGREQGD